MLILDTYIEGCCTSVTPRYRRSSTSKIETITRKVKSSTSFRPKTSALRIVCGIGPVTIRPVARGRKVRIRVSGTENVPVKYKLDIERRIADADEIDIEYRKKDKKYRFLHSNIETVIEVPFSVENIEVHSYDSVYISDMKKQIHKIDISTDSNVTCFAASDIVHVQGDHGDVLLSPALERDSVAQLDVPFGSIMLSPKNTSFIDLSAFGFARPNSLMRHHIPESTGHRLVARGTTLSGKVTTY